MICTDVVGQFRWRLKAGNGEIVAVSEGYIYKSSAKRSVENVAYLAGQADVVDIT
ncbi:MAG TPA: DUF1508 domain-containing protein [bacterium]|nr:DUF1508 domain-containing protein [bacterium]